MSHFFHKLAAAAAVVLTVGPHVLGLIPAGAPAIVSTLVGIAIAVATDAKKVLQVVAPSAE
jgi:hypothetical protein